MIQQLNRIIKHAFCNFLNVVDPYLEDYMFIDPANEMDDESFTKQDEYVKLCTWKMLKERHSEKINDVNVDNVYKVKDVGPVLKSHLELISDRKQDYKNFVLDVLLFAGRFAARCMEKFTYNENDPIFNQVVQVLDEIFDYETSVYEDIQKRYFYKDPLGIPNGILTRSPLEYRPKGIMTINTTGVVEK